jgi:hypothetical protein
MTKFVTVAAFEEAYEDGRLDMEYSEFIMNNCGGDRVIGNGDQLILAMEDFYLYEDFRDSMLDTGFDYYYYSA